MSTDAKNRNEKPNLWAEIIALLLDRTIVLIGLVYILIMVILVWRQAQLEDRLVESAAQEEARRYTEALTTFRTLYSREVVETVRQQNIVVTHDYDQGENKGKAIPLPATLSMMIGNEMAKQELGGQTALYSGYPFPWREEEWKQRGQFAKEAWQALAKNPGEPYQRFEDRDGRRWLRYATADLMRDSCVECHNNHRATPKSDWKVGDVRGVLEVSLPLDSAIAQTKSNLRESIVYTLAIGGLGLVALVFLIGRLRRMSRELERRVEMRTAQLASAELRFRTAVKSAAAAMILVDRDGAMLLVNAETERLFGYSHEELIGKRVEILVPERNRPEHPYLRDNFFASPQARELGQGRDLFGVCKDGSEIPVEIGLSPVETDEGLFVLGTIVDLTERKRLENELRSLNTALAESNEELQQFAYIASHDLQSPLRSIAAFAQFIQKDYQGRLDEQADEYIDRMVGSVKGMQTMINDLLAYSRVESQSVPFQPVDLCQVCDDAVVLLSASIEDVEGEVTRDELPTIAGDRSQLVQLLQNLIGNGVKYGHDDPPRVHVSAEKNGDTWAISVCDNGIGIDAKYHEQIFEIFRRLHTEREYPGTGIGLAICRRIIQRHCGRIWLESEPGKGSTFYFTIPELATEEI